MPALSLSSVVHCTPAVVALLAYVGAGLGYALAARSTGTEDDGPCCSALSHYLDTHAVPNRIETALRAGEVTEGMTRRQVSLLRGVPRTGLSENGRPTWIYDGRKAEMPAWLLVIFENGQVVATRHVSVSERPALPFRKRQRSCAAR